MPSRQRRISRTITAAVLNPSPNSSSSPSDSSRPSRLPLLARILAFFSILQVPLERYEPDLFSSLRQDAWQLSQEEYHDSFGAAHVNPKGLEPAGNLGYSGSVFFNTPDGKFLIKSLNRHFEYDHFEREMLRPYAAHMKANASGSLLVRIIDYLAPAGRNSSAREGKSGGTVVTLGGLLGITPTRYMVMENLLGGKAGDPQRAGEWETYDLKPSDYFFPERDIANGAFSSERTKQRLIDRFDDKIRITKQEYENLRSILESDTALLEATNCVDYSLFLVRYPADLTKCEPVRSNRNEWREGLASSDGRWRYRILLLDFFFAKHRLQPKVMTGLVNAFNIFSRKGPMTITTTPDEYRSRFLNMIDELVETT